MGAPSNLHKQRRSPERYTFYMDPITKFVETEPSSFEELVEKPIWVDAMVEEYESIMRNSACEIFQRPEDKLVVGSRWIFKVKNEIDGSIKKYKATFVAKELYQAEGIDYEETFVFLARYSSIRSIIVLAT